MFHFYNPNWCSFITTIFDVRQNSALCYSYIKLSFMRDTASMVIYHMNVTYLVHLHGNTRWCIILCHGTAIYIKSLRLLLSLEVNFSFVYL